MIYIMFNADFNIIGFESTPGSWWTFQETPFGPTLVWVSQLSGVSGCQEEKAVFLQPTFSPTSLLSSPLERVSTGGAPWSLSLLRTAGNICSWEGDKKGLAAPPCHTFHTTSVPVCFLLQQTITKPSHRTIALCVCLLRLCRTLPDNGMTQGFRLGSTSARTSEYMYDNN